MVPAALIPWLLRLALAASIALVAGGTAWEISKRAERGRLASQLEACAVARAQAEQRLVDVGRSLQLATAAAEDRQRRAAAAASRPPPPAAQTIIKEVQAYAPVESDACQAAVGLARRYHDLVRRLRVDAIDPGSGSDDGAVPDARPGAAPAVPASGGAAERHAADRADPGDGAGS